MICSCFGLVFFFFLLGKILNNSFRTAVNIMSIFKHDVSRWCLFVEIVQTHNFKQFYAKQPYILYNIIHRYNSTFTSSVEGACTLTVIYGNKSQTVLIQLIGWPVSLDLVNFEEEWPGTHAKLGTVTC